MSALTFGHRSIVGRWVGYQPDGEAIGFVRRSRMKDPECAFEAQLLPGLDTISLARGHCGYAPDVDGAKRLLVSGWAFRFGQPS